ncbi:MAG: exosome complex RNA-binding protein Rrp4 [Candidatus Hydrothermarchaeales archaeon]
MRRMVLPGELITEGNYRLGGGVYREKEKIYASVLGLVDERRNYIRVIPMSGKYSPQVGDFVIGTIIDAQFSSWVLDINSAYLGILNGDDYFREIDVFQTDLRRVMPIGEMIFAMIREVSPQKRIYLTMRERGARRIRGGRMLDVTPTKIPRVIGKKTSMVSMIKREAGCEVLVGQNGMVWVNGKDELVEIAVDAIKRIEKEAHTSGLTNKIREMIIEAREKL